MRMILRAYRPSDCQELAVLFCNTVYTVNGKDYTKEQLDAWVSGCMDLEKWNLSFEEHYSIVAEDGAVIAGFGDIDRTGLLNRLFVHKDYQGRGVATAICNKLELAVKGPVTAYVSVTARSYFENRGYRVIRKQQVRRQGIALVNYVMEKAG